MEGLYLYCVKEKNNSEFSEKGIDGGKIFVVPYQDLPPHQSQLRNGGKSAGCSKDWCGDLEAVVSEVSLEEFSSEEIQKKAQEDLNWIKDKAAIHEKVIEEAMGINADLRRLYADQCGKNPRGITAVIPMKFGTIFKTRKNLQETFKKYYPKFKKTLENLTGKQEWGVKVYLDRRFFEKEVKKTSPMIQAKQEEMASMPEGVAYFMQKQIDESVSKEADKALENYTENLLETLKEYIEAGIKGKILEKELTGKSLPMILNAIFLVSEEKLENFVKEIDKLNQEYGLKGFNFEYSGPWPPYNFI